MASKRDPKLENFFQNLSDRYEITSEFCEDYNCIAHAAGDKTEWWQDSHNPRKHRVYWPPVRDDATIEALKAAFEWLGYRWCPNGESEWGYQKVALYATADGRWAHAAKLRFDGRWSSKLGDFEDIAHDTLDGVDHPQYGSAVLFMRRSWPRGILRWSRVRIFGIRSRYRWLP